MCQLYQKLSPLQTISYQFLMDAKCGPNVGTIYTRYWIQIKEIRFKNYLKDVQDVIFAENVNNKLSSNSLEGHKVLKSAAQLPKN